MSILKEEIFFNIIFIMEILKSAYANLVLLQEISFWSEWYLVMEIYS